MRRLWTALASLLCLGCAAHPELPTVARVDLPRYMGQWHEIARYPNDFQKGCRDSTAQYELLPEGGVRVVNECIRDGMRMRATARAKVTDAATNAKLKVTFFWPFSGKYWIVDLGKDYEYAVVSEPSRRYLWILAREPELPIETLRQVTQRLAALGFDTSRLLWNGTPPRL